MPNKPTTLREEFYEKFAVWNQKYKFAEDATPVDVADFFLSHFSQHLQKLAEEMEKKKRDVDERVIGEGAMKDYGYNQALDQVISFINQEK